MESNLSESLKENNSNYKAILDYAHSSSSKLSNKNKEKNSRSHKNFLRNTITNNFKSVKGFFSNTSENENENENGENLIINRRTTLHTPIGNKSTMDIFNISETNLMQNSLISMGFELRMINNLLKYLHITSIEMATEYLTKTDNKWNHQFISGLEENTNNLICAICNENADMHLDYSLFKSEEASTELIRNYSNEKIFDFRNSRLIVNNNENLNINIDQENASIRIKKIDNKNINYNKENKCKKYFF